MTGGIRAAEMLGTTGDLDVEVDVYRNVPVYYSVLLGGKGRTHTVGAHNVMAAWKGHDSPPVRAAMNELR